MKLSPVSIATSVTSSLPLVALLVLALGGCGSSAAGGSGGSGAGTGGRGTGGASATGGATGTGGGTSSGGAMGTGGGAPGTGGSTATGGSSGSGGGSGSGGNSGSGGTTGTGGGSGSGGTIGTGGSTGSGGAGGTPAGGTGGAGTAAFTCPAGPHPAPMLTGLTPTRITGAPPSDAFNNNRNNFGIVEGPVWAGDALYFSEIGGGNSPPPSRILKLTPPGTVTIALATAGTNGLALDASGNLIGGNHKDGAITRFTLPALTPSPVVAAYNGQRFNSPNDLTLRADGNLYFTDPDYQAPSPRPQAQTRVYRLAPGTTAPTVVIEGRVQPNGVTLSPDGNTLYVTGSDGLFRYPVNADGSVGTGTKIAQSIGGADGMAIDCAGNLYVTSNNSVVVVSPAATVLGTISGIQGSTNAAFGGADRKTLYITALGSGTQSGLYSVPMNLPGYPY